MQEENTDKAGASIQAVILTWVEELLHKNVLSTAPTFGLDEWICAGLLWARIAPDSLYAYCQGQLAQNEQVPALSSGLALAGISAQLPQEQSSIFEQLAKKHLQWAEELDTEEGGLLQWPSADATYFPVIQASWVWSSDQLLTRELPSEQVAALIQLKEVFTYETDRQLWDQSRKAYADFPALHAPEAVLLTNNALALLAWIPDQDRAEELLENYRKQAPPWQSSDLAVKEWLGPAAYLLHLGLKAYEMTQAAEELKDYVLKHLLQMAKTAEQECLLWLWRNIEH